MGSGRGEKRKREDEYSTNPHTIKARKRYSNMGPHEKAVHAAKTAERSALSKMKKKLKESAGWNEKSEEEQTQMVWEETERLRQVR